MKRADARQVGRHAMDVHVDHGEARDDVFENRFRTVAAPMGHCRYFAARKVVKSCRRMLMP